jgi:hypothetical protein
MLDLDINITPKTSLSGFDFILDACVYWPAKVFLINRIKNSVSTGSI